MKKIKLLEHQIKPIEYLVARCQKQHGLILNHYMGTGKTITGIVFLKNFPNEKKTIILPRGFESIWKAEANKLGLSPDTITFITFDQLSNFEIYKKDIENSICIVDEAHNLYKIIYDLYEIQSFDKEQKIKPRLIEFIDLLYSTKKILLLTGTLIKGRQLSDIRWLINIAAGKENSVVPFNEDEFLNKYEKISNMDRLWLQAFKPFLNLNPFNLIPKNLISKQVLNEKNIANVVYSLITDQAFSYIMQKKIKTPLIYSNKGIFDKARYVELLQASLTYLLDYNSILHMLFLTILIKGTRMVFKYAKAYYDEAYNFDQLDVEKLLNSKVKHYFSYFNYKFIKTKDYPIVKEQFIKVKYTRMQLVLLIKLIGIPENLKEEEYVLLEFNNNIREAELFKSMYTVSSKFIDKGRIIGNLFDEPEKFKQILNIYEKSNREQTVVYSNFYNSGLILFSKYLSSKKINHTIFDQSLSDNEKIKILTDFKSKKIKMLLLHPDFYEGISISGCKYLHILEPVLRTEVREQLLARVVRYKSHSHLEKKEQNVKIYQWSCTLLYDFNKILQSKEYVNQWLQSNDPYRSVLELFSNFKGYLSPDDTILSYYNNYTNFSTQFHKTIQAISIDNEKNIPLNCCIWTPDNSCSNKKLISCVENTKITKITKITKN